MEKGLKDIVFTIDNRLNNYGVIAEYCNWLLVLQREGYDILKVEIRQRIRGVEIYIVTTDKKVLEDADNRIKESTLNKLCDYKYVTDKDRKGFKVLRTDYGIIITFPKNKLRR